MKGWDLRHTFCNFSFKKRGMLEFTISFQYADEMHRAGVLKSSEQETIEYDVRPITPAIVQKFGKQITIYRENEHFNANNHIDADYREFFEALVKALREQDVEEASQR